MADRRVSEDTEILGVNVAAGDLFDVVDVSDSTDAVSGTNKKITAAETAAAVTALGALATTLALSTAVTVHNGTTTAVHGMADTADLLRASDAVTLALALADDPAANLSALGVATVGATFLALTTLLTQQQYLSTQSVNAQTGTTYTLVASDSTKLVTLSNAAAITLTVPQDSDVTWAIGDRCALVQLGAGQVTVAAGTGATLRATPSAKSREQYSRLSLQKIAANTWQLSGDLAPARHFTRVYRSATQSISTSTLTTISFDTERYDDDGLWAIGTPTDFVIPFAGLWAFGACIGLEATDTDRSFQVDIYNNTTSTILTELGGSGFGKSLSTSDNPSPSSETVAPCAAGDHIRVRAYQASGSSLNTGGGTATTWNNCDFWAYLVTPT